MKKLTPRELKTASYKEKCRLMKEIILGKLQYVDNEMEGQINIYELK